jgi:hypothetical protein
MKQKVSGIQKVKAAGQRLKAQAAENGKVGGEQIALLRNSLLFGMTRHFWGNTAQADDSMIEAEADKEWLTVSQQLIQCPEYDALIQYQNKVYAWCCDHSMKSVLRKGVYFVKRDRIKLYDSVLTAARQELRTRYLPAFLKVYDDYVEKAKAPKEAGGLGKMFNPDNYYTKEELAGKFGIEWSIFALSIPNELPSEIYERENKKLRQSFVDAENEVRYVLRLEAKKLIAGLLERIHPASGDKKMFKENTTSAIRQFVTTFRDRDMTEDAELGGLVDQLDGVLGKMPDAASLRDSSALRTEVAGQFAELNAAVSAMVVNKPTRHVISED